MGILESLLGSVWKKETTDWTFGPIKRARIAAPYAADERPLETGKDYIKVMLRAMRIPYVQKATSKYFGAVHSFISVPRPLSPGNAFHVFTAPSHLKSLDAANLDRVIPGDKVLFGPTPYHGGDGKMEMALFSVKSADLCAPYVTLLGKLSEAAGTTRVGAAAALLPLLKTGIGLLTESTDAVTMEVGVDKAFAATSGCYVAARAPAQPTRLDAYSIARDGALLENGKPVKEYPYFVFTIEATRNRGDWAEVQDVSEPYARLLELAKKGDQKEAASVFEELKRRARLSLDLVPADAEEIILWIDGQLKRAFPGQMHAARARPEMESLNRLPLYQRP
jgi:hypothetical protein